MAQLLEDRLIKLQIDETASRLAQVDEIASWQKCRLMKLQVDEIASWWNCKLIKLHVDEIANWWNSKPINAGSWNFKLMTLQVGEIGKLMKWKVDKMAR